MTEMKTNALAFLCVLGAGIAPSAGGGAVATAEGVQTVTEGPDWVALDYVRDIVPGSALDFSGQGLHDAPAGKYGWLVSRNGHAEFDGRPGVPARFYGVNLCNSANYLSDDEIERVTDRLVRLGYNAVRIHHHDSAWADAHARRESQVRSPKSQVSRPNRRKGDERGGRRNAEAEQDASQSIGTEAEKEKENASRPLPTADAKQTPLSPRLAEPLRFNIFAGEPPAPPDDAIDRLDALMAACIRKGIYLTTDLYVSRRCSWRELGIDRDGDADSMSAKLLMMTTDAGFENWKRFASDFLTHVNPCTGRCLAEEPAMPMLVLINEASPHSDWDKAKSLPEFRALWPQWLEEARAANPGAYPAAAPDAFPEKGGWWDPSPENSAKAAFWAWVCGRFSKRASAFLRDDLGVKAMLSTENNGPVLPSILQMRTAAGDYVDFHYYVEHANSASQAMREETGLPLTGVFRNHNPLRDTRGMYPDAAFCRVWGRPLVVSESQMGGPNFNRAMGGLLTGTFASVQDWTGIWTFALAHSREKLFDGIDAAPGRFDLSLDPLMQATDRLPVLLFLRGDQATPEAAFANAFSAEAMQADSEGRVSLSSRPSWAKRGLEWRARLGVSFEGMESTEWKEPRGRRNPAAQWEASRNIGSRADNEDENAPRPLPTPDAKPKRLTLGSAETLGSDNSAGEPPAPPGCGVSVDAEKGEIVVAGPRTCAGFVHDGGSFEAGALTAKVRGHSALVAATALDGTGLADASRILVWHLTDLHGEGFTWGGDIVKSSYWRQTGILDWGSSRPMLHAGEAEVSLKLERDGSDPAAQNPDRRIVSPAPSGDIKVYALDTAGNRRAEVSATYNSSTGHLRFTASSRQPFGGCLYYEVVRK